jgi:hypothetical protein
MHRFETDAPVRAMRGVKRPSKKSDARHGFELARGEKAS